MLIGPEATIGADGEVIFRLRFAGAAEAGVLVSPMLVAPATTERARNERSSRFITILGWQVGKSAHGERHTILRECGSQPIF